MGRHRRHLLWRPVPAALGVLADVSERDAASGVRAMKRRGFLGACAALPLLPSFSSAGLPGKWDPVRTIRSAVTPGLEWLHSDLRDGQEWISTSVGQTVRNGVPGSASVLQIDLNCRPGLALFYAEAPTIEAAKLLARRFVEPRSYRLQGNVNGMEMAAKDVVAAYRALGTPTYREVSITPWGSLPVSVKAYRDWAADFGRREQRIPTYQEAFDYLRQQA
jgi:hypothetical protein